jgi:PAS domain-containing protein
MDDGNHHVDPPADGVGVVTYDLDLQTGVLTWSESLYQVFGYSHDEPVNTVEWWTHHIHPNDAMGVNEIMDMVMYPWVKEWMVYYRFEKSDHTYVMVHDRVHVVRDPDGRALRLTGTIWQ